MTTKEEKQPTSQSTDNLESNRSVADKDNRQKENDDETVSYWKNRHGQLEEDYRSLQKLNQTLEDRLLNVVEDFESKKKELLDKVEYEKSTLMADVDKLSTKLVDARIKLHDYEEREMMLKAEYINNSQTTTKTNVINKAIDRTCHNPTDDYDPNII